HNANSHHANANAGLLRLARLPFPLHAQLAHEVMRGRTLLRQFLVAVRAVPTDGRGIDQHLRRTVSATRVPGNRLDDIRGRLSPAIDQELLEGGVPALVENVFASQV